MSSHHEVLCSHSARCLSAVEEKVKRCFDVGMAEGASPADVDGALADATSELVRVVYNRFTTSKEWNADSFANHVCRHLVDLMKKGGRFQDKLVVFFSKCPLFLHFMHQFHVRDPSFLVYMASCAFSFGVNLRAVDVQRTVVKGILFVNKCACRTNLCWPVLRCLTVFLRTSCIAGVFFDKGMHVTCLRLLRFNKTPLVLASLEVIYRMHVLLSPCEAEGWKQDVVEEAIKIVVSSPLSAEQAVDARAIDTLLSSHRFMGVRGAEAIAATKGARSLPIPKTLSVAKDLIEKHILSASERGAVSEELLQRAEGIGANDVVLSAARETNEKHKRKAVGCRKRTREEEEEEEEASEPVKRVRTALLLANSMARKGI